MKAPSTAELSCPCQLAGVPRGLHSRQSRPGPPAASRGSKRARPTLAGRRSSTTSAARLPQPLPSSAKAVFGTTPNGFAVALTGHPATTAEFFPLDQNQIVNAAPQPVRAVDGGLEISLKKDENFRTPLAQLNGVLLLGDGTAYEIHAPPGVATGGRGGAPAAACSKCCALLLLPFWAASF